MKCHYINFALDLLFHNLITSFAILARHQHVCAIRRIYLGADLRENGANDAPIRD